MKIKIITIGTTSFHSVYLVFINIHSFGRSSLLHLPLLFFFQINRELRMIKLFNLAQTFRTYYIHIELHFSLAVIVQKRRDTKPGVADRHLIPNLSNFYHIFLLYRSTFPQSFISLGFLVQVLYSHITLITYTYAK